MLAARCTTCLNDDLVKGVWLQSPRQSSYVSEPCFHVLGGAAMAREGGAGAGPASTGGGDGAWAATAWAATPSSASGGSGPCALAWTPARKLAMDTHAVAMPVPTASAVLRR